VKAYQAEHPDAPIIRMGIGDVTEPLPPACLDAMHKAVDDLGRRETFHGYGPEQGYEFLREAIAANDFRARGCDIAADEIFVSDGSKCDCGNILDILGPGNTIAITDPVYPVYVDSNVMAGNTGAPSERGEYAGLVYLPATIQNNFTPELPPGKVDVIYLCYPNNPTGTVITRSRLAQWVEYARQNRAVIFYDAAYEAYIAQNASEGLALTSDVPHSIYEIPGARHVAVEFRSFSKTAGFTGVRCAFTVVPKSLTGRAADGSEVPLQRLWHRRHTTKFNGVSYVVQRGAAAIYSDAGRAQVRALIDFYMSNASLIKTGLSKAGLNCFGGEHAPYVWVQTPPGCTSWQFFDRLLGDANVVCTPGSGFGSAGEGFVRISAFNSRANVECALERIRSIL
jgi:LL-diaminopimelate aminotransferase